jgi:hypothetical protein
MKSPGIRITIDTFDGTQQVQQIVFDQRDLHPDAFLDFQKKVVFPMANASLEWTAAMHAAAVEMSKGKGPASA